MRVRSNWFRLDWPINRYSRPRLEISSNRTRRLSPFSVSGIIAGAPDRPIAERVSLPPPPPPPHKCRWSGDLARDTRTPRCYAAGPVGFADAATDDVGRFPVSVSPGLPSSVGQLRLFVCPGPPPMPPPPAAVRVEHAISVFVLCDRHKTAMACAAVKNRESTGSVGFVVLRAV